MPSGRRLVLSQRSQFFDAVQAKLRSTTQRLGMTVEPFGNLHNGGAHKSPSRTIRVARPVGQHALHSSAALQA